MRKYSRQRELILNYLKETKSHPSAEQIYADLKPENPALSLSTVYRNLNLLSEYGLIQKLAVGESGERFDADTSDHGHFICSDCHCVTDVCSLPLDKESLATNIEGDCLINQYKLFLYGICGKCRAVKNV